MSQPATKKYAAEFKERAVTLAVEADQPIAQTARDLGVKENTRHPWSGTYHRVARQDKQVNDAHLYEELQRLRKENARLQEERALVKKAATYCAQQLPCSPPGCSSRRSAACVACVDSWQSRAVAPTSGSTAHPACKLRLISSDRIKSRAVLHRGVGRMARAGSNIS
jgi:transposase